MGHPMWSARSAFGLPPRLTDAGVEAAILASAAALAAEGVVIDPQDLALIGRRRRGEISRKVFLRQLRDLTMAKLWEAGERNASGPK